MSKRLATGGVGNWGSHFGGDNVSGELVDGHLYLASSSEMDGVVLHSVSLRDLLSSERTSEEKFSLAAAPTTSGNVKVATEAEGAGGERASLESGGRESKEGPNAGKFDGVGKRGGLEAPQQLVRGSIGALWTG